MTPNDAIQETDRGPSNAASVRVRDLSKHFDIKSGTERVFEGVSFDIEPGKFVTLVGKSGSGKSTVLKIISGVIEQSSGEISVRTADGEEATIGHVFQSPRLLPWETCIDNIEFVNENNPDYMDEVGRHYLDLVGLSDHADKYPTQLSGGQNQRVGIARALSIDPDILLMDEPFSNLDEITASQLRTELIEIWQELNKTVLFVTHDIDEAIELSDRILMLGGGRVYDDMEIHLERPRNVASPEFLMIRDEAIDRFRAG